MKKSNFKKFISYCKQIHLFEFMFHITFISIICILANVPSLIQIMIESAIASAFMNTWSIEKRLREKEKFVNYIENQLNNSQSEVEYEEKNKS